MTEPTLYELACGLLELRDRVIALEAAGSVAGNSGHAPAAPVTTAEGLSPVEPTPTTTAAPAGEGAPAPKRVVLPEEPPAPVSNPKWFFAGDFRYVQGRRDGWKAARAEVERQQQGGQADG